MAKLELSPGHATDLTRQLLAFSRRQLLQPTVLDLNEVVRGMDSLMRRLIGEDVDLRTEPGATLGHVKADRGQLEQVIVNLVVNARDGEEALRLVEQHAGPIDLVLTDVVLPQMSGRELISRLAPRVPSAAVLFMSGYTHNAIQHHGVLERGIEFLQKPFGPNDLARRVREVLDARKMP